MELHELWIVCGFVVLQAFLGTLIRHYQNSPNATDTYILSDSSGHKIRFKVKRHASEEARQNIFNEKLRELEQLQTA